MDHRFVSLRFAAQVMFVRAMVASSIGAPARFLTRRFCRHELVIKGVRVYYGEPGHSTDAEESELLLRGIRRLENDGGLWPGRLSRHLRLVFLTHEIDNMKYGLADWSCLVSAKTALLFEDDEVGEVFIAACLIVATAALHLLRGGKGPVGVVCSSDLAAKCGVRFMIRSAKVSRNAGLHAMANEFQRMYTGTSLHGWYE